MNSLPCNPAISFLFEKKCGLFSLDPKWVVLRASHLLEDPDLERDCFIFFGFLNFKVRA